MTNPFLRHRGKPPAPPFAATQLFVCVSVCVCIYIEREINIYINERAYVHERTHAVCLSVVGSERRAGPALPPATAPRPPRPHGRREPAGGARGALPPRPKGLMAAAAAPPAGSPPRSRRRRSPGGGGVGRRRLPGLGPLSPEPPAAPTRRREAAQRLPSLGFRSPSPRAGAAFDNCKDNRKSGHNAEPLRGPGQRRGLPGPPPPPPRRAGGGGRPRREGAPPRWGRSPPAGPAGTEGPFVPPTLPVPRGGERDPGGGTAPGRREGGGGREAAGPPARRDRERPRREEGVPREALPGITVKNLKAKLGPGEKNNRGDLLPLT